MGFHLFGAFIPYYGFCIATGIVCACFLGYILCKKNSLNIDDFIILGAYLVGFGFLGAKLLYIFISIKPSDLKWIFSSLSNFNAVMNSGFVFYGGLIGGLLALPFVKKVHKINTYAYIKCLVPSLGIAHAFGRLGCSLAGCCYGIRTSCPIHFVYTKSIIAPNGIPLFPVQGIEALSILILTATCLVLVLKKSRIKVERLYLMSYSTIRFILEFFRGDPERGRLLFLSTSQIISLAIFLSVLALCIRDKFKQDADTSRIS